MKLYKAKGYILKIQNFGDNDKIVWILSDKVGKISLFAKSVRTIKSKRGSHLDILNKNTFTLYRGKSLDSIRETTSLKDYLVLKKFNPYVFFFIGEILDKIEVEPDEGKKIFKLLEDTLDNSTELDLYKSLIFFEINLLKLMGFEPNLTEYLDSGNKLQADSLYYSPDTLGYFEHPTNSPVIDPNIIKCQRIFLTGNINLAKALQLSNKAINLIHQIQSKWIQNVTEKQIRSLEFLVIK